MTDKVLPTGLGNPMTKVALVDCRHLLLDLVQAVHRQDSFLRDFLLEGLVGESYMTNNPFFTLDLLVANGAARVDLVDEPRD